MIIWFPEQSADDENENDHHFKIALISSQAIKQTDFDNTFNLVNMLIYYCW